ncbi:DUF6344 domain-containing protein [Streptomyces sp. NPDC090112]|uniref:DUF6344 domain-containing protein n=1 Tax=Streptomyces sp. NPDC090112 TaxID=3365949 RepID=UPI00382FD958
MAQRTVLTSIWTPVLAALVALLSVLGLGRKTAPVVATAAAPAAAPAAPAAAPAPAARPAVAARRSWRAMMRGGALPPTIKQRIRAEAHGKTPSVRRSTTAAAMGAGSASGTGAAGGAVVVPGRAGRIPHQTAAARRAATTRESLDLAA